MSDEKGTHPTAEQLQRYSVFACGEEEWRWIGEHLRQCEDCEFLMLELLADIDPGGAGDQAQ